MSEVVGLLVLIAIAFAALLVIMTAMLVHEATHPPRRTAAYAIARGIAVDPGELDLEYEEWTLDRPDGARIAVWEIALGGSGAHTAVFVHGWGQSRIDMLQRIDPWRSACRRVVLYDLRGHGESTGSSKLGHREDEDLIDLLERLGDGSFVLVGSSMGAGIAITAAARDSAVRDRIAGVVTYGAYHDFHSSLRGRLRNSGYPVRPFTDLAMAWFGMRGFRPRDHRAEASRLACPLLVIHGSDDAVVSFEQAEAIAAGARAASVHRVDGGGHGNEHAVGAEDHDDVVQAFLTELRTDPPRPATAAGR